MNKKIKFDGEELFGGGEGKVEVLSWRRECVERSFGGLDGVVSVDMGRRERKFKQRGQLLADSESGLRERMDVISAYIDGQAYKLVDQGGVAYGRVRMDSFKAVGPIVAGGKVRCEYEISYTQLGD